MDGHRDCFRTLIRRILRDDLGFSQLKAQEGAEDLDYWMHRTVVEKACKIACTGNWLGGAGTIAVDCGGTYRAMRYCYFTREGLKETFKRKALGHLFGKLRNSEKLSPGLKFALRALEEIF